MAHLSGLLLIDCPASALNNMGSQGEMSKPERRYDNWSTVKFIRTKEGFLPYVSAQAFRYWLRDTLADVPGWTPSPIFREEKIAYTDANPIAYAEDDLFGYMRAPGGSENVDQKWADKGLTTQEKAKKGFVALTRVSPFKVSTLISVAPLKELGFDYGTMSRGEGDPVPYVHEFYRTTLVGLFSVDLGMIGRFYHVDRTGFRHLDSVRKQIAADRGLASYDNGRAFELDLETRAARLRQLLEGLSRITGGAKQSVHYTEVAPKLLFMAVSRGGNHLFGTSVGANEKGLPKINENAIEEAGKVFGTDLLSGFYTGLTQGYLDEQRSTLEKAIAGVPGSYLAHPVQAVRRLIEDIEGNAATWLA